MGKIVLEIEEFGKTYCEYKTFNQDVIRIGRGFDNDVILNDPYVGAFHLIIRDDQGAWVCENQQNKNGTYLCQAQIKKQKQKILSPMPLQSGDILYIGKSIIKAYKPEEAVAAEKVLDNYALDVEPQKIRRSFLVALINYLVVFYFLGTLSIWKNDHIFAQIALGVLYMVVVLMLWSGGWALITRFSRKEHRFIHHFIFALRWSVFSILTLRILSFAVFFLCNQSFAIAIELGFYAGFGLYLISSHLAIATHLSAQKRNLFATLIVAAAMVLFCISIYDKQNEFNTDPAHYFEIVPMRKSWIPTISINDQIHRLDEIF